MKKWSFLFILCVLAFSCAKVEQQDAETIAVASSIETRSLIPAPGEGEMVVVLPERIIAGETKVSLTMPAEGGLSPEWEYGDAISVTAGSETRALSFKHLYDEKTALVDKPSLSGSRFTICYPSNYTSLSQMEAVSYTGQVQEGNGDFSHIKYYAVLDGVSDYENPCFESPWAASKGGKFYQSSVLRFVIDAPTDFGGLASLKISCPNAIFHTTNAASGTTKELSMNFRNTQVQDGRLIAYMAVSWQPITFPDGKSVTVTLTDDEGFTYTKTFIPEKQTLYGGKVNDFALTAKDWKTDKSDVSGAGTSASPYLIRSATGIAQMRSLMVSGKTVYFKLTKDINMTGVEWTPLNDAEPFDKAISFDGDGHTLSNFTCQGKSYGSFVGILNGTMKNVNFTSPHITGGGAQAIAAAWLGNINGKIVGNISNVNITSGQVDATGQYAGGLCAKLGKGSISNCRVDANVTASDCFGGIGGFTYVDISISGCTTSGNLTPTGTNIYPCIGGILGSGYGTVSITNCSSSCNLTSTGTSTGGIFGQTGYAAASGDTPAQGVDLTIDKCSFTGQVKATTYQGYYAGGIVAYARNVKSLKITRCFSTGNISACYRTGGILGYSNNSEISGATVLIENCWASGTITSTSYKDTNNNSKGGGQAGGIAGDIQKNVIIRNCYFAGMVKGNYCSGGIVGLANNGVTSSASIVTSATTSGGFGDTVSGCICWAELITSQDNYKRSTEKGFSDGAIVGFTNVYNTLSNCWRKPGLNFLWYSSTHGGSEWNPTFNALTDQADASSSKALTGFPQGKTAPNQSPYQYDYPYNGKAAASDKTLSQVAQGLSWSSSVWDFSGDSPLLK